MSSRACLDYAAGADAAPRVDFRADEPTAGFYRMSLVKGGHPVGVRVWHGRPLDPITGEELDRSLRWQAVANGEYIDLDRVWPGCARDPITEQEYEYLASLARWAKEHAPHAPQANPRKPVDLLTAPLPL